MNGWAGRSTSRPPTASFLVRLAAATVHARLGGTPVDGQVPRSPVLRRVGCSFVTLERDHTLRGCIGTLEPSRPLYRDVVRNAARAMTDPRLPPVSRRRMA